LELSIAFISDQLLDELIPRCTNLKSLALPHVSGISDRSVTTIINHLQYSLEQLDLNTTKDDSDITLDKLMELRSMKKLKYLACNYKFEEHEIQTLKNNLPQLTKPINKLGVTLIAEFKAKYWYDKVKRLRIFKNYRDDFLMSSDDESDEQQSDEQESDEQQSDEQQSDEQQSDDAMAAMDSDSE